MERNWAEGQTSIKGARAASRYWKRAGHELASHFVDQLPDVGQGSCKFTEGKQFTRIWTCQLVSMMGRTAGYYKTEERAKQSLKAISHLDPISNLHCSLRCSHRGIRAGRAEKRRIHLEWIVAVAVWLLLGQSMLEEGELGRKEPRSTHTIHTHTMHITHTLAYNNIGTHTPLAPHTVAG